MSDYRLQIRKEFELRKKTRKYLNVLLLTEILKTVAFVLVAVYVKLNLIHNAALEPNVRNLFEGLSVQNGQALVAFQSWSDVTSWLDLFLSHQFFLVPNDPGRISAQNYVISVNLFRFNRKPLYFFNSSLQYVPLRENDFPYSSQHLFDKSSAQTNCSAYHITAGTFAPGRYSGTRTCTVINQTSPIIVNAADVSIGITLVSGTYVAGTLCLPSIDCFNSYGEGHVGTDNITLAAYAGDWILNGTLASDASTISASLTTRNLTCQLHLSNENLPSCVSSRLLIRNLGVIDVLAAVKSPNISAPVAGTDFVLGNFSIDSSTPVARNLIQNSWANNETISISAQINMINMPSKTALNVIVQWYIETSGFISFDMQLGSIPFCDFFDGISVVVTVLGCFCIIIFAANLALLLWSFRRLEIMLCLPDFIRNSHFLINQPPPDLLTVGIELLEQMLFWWTTNDWLREIISPLRIPLCFDQGITSVGLDTSGSDVVMNDLEDRVRLGNSRKIELFQIMGVLILFMFLKIFRMIPISSQLSLLTRVVTRASGDLFHFGIVFSLFIFAYAATGVILFSQFSADYTNFFDASRALLTALINGSMNSQFFINTYPDSVVPSVFYITFSIIAILVLANIFVAILNAAFLVIKKNDEKEMKPFPLHARLIFFRLLAFLRRRKSKLSIPFEDVGHEGHTFDDGTYASLDVCDCESRKKKFEMEVENMRQILVQDVEKIEGVVAIANVAAENFDSEQEMGKLSDIVLPPPELAFTTGSVRVSWQNSIVFFKSHLRKPAGFSLQIKEGHKKWRILYTGGQPSTLIAPPSASVVLLRVQAVFDSGARTRWGYSSHVFLPALHVDDDDPPPPPPPPADHVMDPTSGLSRRHRRAASPITIAGEEKDSDVVAFACV